MEEEADEKKWSSERRRKLTRIQTVVGYGGE